MDNREKEHLLALKVMRLTRPSLCTTFPIFSETNDLNHDHFECCLEEDIASPASLKEFNCGNLLILPQSFGNIYLGETFSCYMSVHNDSNNTVKNVSVQADLQIGPQKLMLTHHEDSCLITELKPNQSVDDVIHHEVKEIGTHILACTVNYTADYDEKMYFRKFFKFQVSKPLDVKTKFYNSEMSEVYLEAQLQNITSSPMCLEKVFLESTASFVSQELNSVSLNEGNQQVFGSISCLSPLDSRQYLFRLTPRNESHRNTKFLKGITAIGKLDIVWHTNMGERGHLQTSQLERMAPTYSDIKLSVEEIPSIVNLEKSFVISCQLTNTCERSLNLMLTVINSPTSGIQWQGISDRHLNTLESQCSVNLQLIAIPIRTGLLMVNGIRLTDTFLKRTYDYDELAQVFVCNNFKASHS